MMEYSHKWLCVYVCPCIRILPLHVIIYADMGTAPERNGQAELAKAADFNLMA